ncbi:MAG: DUF4380 domain-containing protein [Acidobacteriia bacterium]|nr:DUF4380 domain-containing protein [Terriglobia bacterium]
MKTSSCTITAENYKGWKALRVANGILEVFIVPEIGGRIIQLRLGENDFLYVNPRHLGRVYPPEQNNLIAGWKNYGGSKVWPAPQGWSSDAEWPGPPDPILDGSPYSCRIAEDDSGTVAAYLESPADEYTGLTLAREIRVRRDAAQVFIRHTMRNTSARPVSWGVWEVTQHVAHEHFWVFVPGKEYRQMFGDREYKDIHCQDQPSLWRLHYTNQVAKFAVQAAEGWVATLDSQRGVVYAGCFKLFPGAHYPDGAPVEVWVSGEGTFTIHGDRVDPSSDPNGCDALVETEILSPQVRLEPGEEYTFPITWSVAHLGTDEVTAINPCAAVGRRLEARREDKALRLTGTFGVFRNGTLELVTVERSGKTGAVRSVGAVSPLKACTVDQRMPWGESVGRVSLRLRDAAGTLLGTVDECAIR